MKKRIICLIIIGMLMVPLVAGCGDKSSLMNGDIITQKAVAEDKIPVTVLVKYAFSINTFETAAEAKFPKLDIIQVGNYTSEMGKAEYAARMKNEDLTDIVMTWPLDVGEEYWEERLIEMSALPFTDKYVTSMLDNISRDGKLYYLPGPSQVRGIVYNKTLFKENNWQVPTAFDGFVALCKEIEKSGMRSLQLGFENKEVLDTAFVGYGYDSSLSKPENAQWLADYNKGQGGFGDNFAPALETFQMMIDEGIFKPEDLTVDYAERENMFFNRKCAMVEDSVLIARMGYDYNGCTDEFALMPFFNPGEESDWVRLYPVCFIGVSKELEKSENKEKLELVMQLLEYISTPDGQFALSGDTGAMFSSLNDVSPPEIPEIFDLLPALTHGRYAIFPTLDNAQDALRNGLAGMVSGEMTGGKVSAIVDNENRNPKPVPEEKVIATAKEDFSLIETGSFITDVMREQSNSDIALFLDNGKDGRFNGKGVSGKIYKGDITQTDIKRILPDLKLGEKGEALQVTMTGENLIKVLEYSLPVNNNQDGWFYYFSGLKMEYAPSETPGTRIKSITDINDKPIEPTKEYTVAVMDFSVPDELVSSSKPLGLLISEMLEIEFENKGEISPAKDGRFKVIA